MTEKKQFEKLVAEALGVDPAPLSRRHEQHRHRRRKRARAGAARRDGGRARRHLLGLYQGTPLTERRWDYGNTLPDRILLFQGPLERESEGPDDRDGIIVAIGETLIHEIGHYFGLSEDEIEAIEERYLE